MAKTIFSEWANLPAQKRDHYTIVYAVDKNSPVLSNAPRTSNASLRRTETINMNTSKMPLWVKLSSLGAILLVILFLVAHLSGHGFHHHHA